MKETENINIEIGNINISAFNIQLAHSLGFSLFCRADNKGIEEEISRIERDLVILSTTETTENIDVEELIRIAENSKNIMNKLGYTEEVSELILNCELVNFTRTHYLTYINRLSKYKDLLLSFSQY